MTQQQYIEAAHLLLGRAKRAMGSASLEGAALCYDDIRVFVESRMEGCSQELVDQMVACQMAIGRAIDGEVISKIGARTAVVAACAAAVEAITAKMKADAVSLRLEKIIASLDILGQVVVAAKEVRANAVRGGAVDLEVIGNMEMTLDKAVAEIREAVVAG